MAKLARAAELLRAADHIVILSHRSPDGDTLGSAAALYRALRKLGKTVRCECADAVPEKYGYLFAGIESPEFDPEFVVSVDVADRKLLGTLNETYGDRIDLAVDHHASHVDFAREQYVDSRAAATCEIICDLIALLGMDADADMATAIFTGIATDTGCLRYSNATPRSYRMAAAMMERGADAAEINRRMFETKTRARVEMERAVMDSMTFYLDGKCAVIRITEEAIARSGAEEGDLEGLASLPRQIEGVLAGVTLRERPGGECKVSLRTQAPVDAAAICGKFGGGGHIRAAGCSLMATLDDAERTVVSAVAEALRDV